MSRQFSHKLCICFVLLMALLFSAIASFAETINYGYDNMQRLNSVKYGDGTDIILNSITGKKTQEPRGNRE